MIIEVARISEDGSTYEGEEPGAILELEKDKFAHADGPVRYRIEARIVSREVVVRGRLSADVSLLCGRCGGFFSTTIEVSSFLRAFSISEGTETLDLTADFREDILLELPSYPACSWGGESGVCPHSGVNLDDRKGQEQPGGDNRWDALDQLSSE